MKKSFIIGVLIILLIGCQSTGLKVGNWDVGKIVNAGATLIDSQSTTVEEEITIGENLASMLLGVSPLYNNNQQQIYVNMIGNHLASHARRNELKWYFAILDSQEINAFAAPGGYVFITKGLLDMLSSEAELAAVLAHEIAHTELSHQIKSIKSGDSQNALSDIAFASVSAYQGNTGASQRDQDYAQYAQTLTSFSLELYTKGLSKDDEFAADEEAAFILSRAGYDIYSLASVLKKLESFAADDFALASLYKTHPKPTERLKKVSPILTKLEQTTSNWQTLSERFAHNMSQ